MLQLADVPRPVVVEQHAHRVRGDALQVLVETSRGPLQELLRERRDRLAPLAQRRYRNDERGQAVEEILPEGAGVDGGAKIAVRGRDNPRARLDARLAAHPPDLALLQRAQQLRLEAGRHLADLVEKQRAGAGHLEEAGLVADRVGERAANVAEQLRFEQRLGEGGTVDRHQRLSGPGALFVDHADHVLLAGAALAEDEHARVERGDARGQFERSRMPLLTRIICERRAY